MALWLAVLATFAVAALTWKARAVSGTVRDETGVPIPGAVVRVRATTHSTTADGQGRFTLSGFPPASRLRVTAWAEGRYIAGQAVWPWTGEVTLTLLPYAGLDNEAYEWMPPAVEGRSAWETVEIRARLDPTGALALDALFFKAADGLALGCRDCHAEVIYAQWAGGAHALGIANARFASMYNGTDLTGENRSPATRYGFDRDYGRFPLRPDTTQPYFGPGYRLDFPETAGNCAACHLPTAALADAYGADPNAVTGVDALGSHCDFCHKISGVRLDPATGLPYDNMPGVLSLVMMRPAPEKQLFFGPYDDVDAGTDTYLPLQRESQFCAPCHTASFWGVPVYQSFAEWQASSYADPGTGRTCQDCHMRPGGVTTNFAPGRAGNERDADEIFTHTFPGAADEDLLRNAVTMNVDARRDGEAIRVRVEIVNDRTGHHVPTDSPLRQMILLVRATDGQGHVLRRQSGPVVPEWGGVGDPAEGNYAELPGTAYAKVLQELWTEVAPTGAYWNPTRVLSDNRIPAFAADTTEYAFALPDTGAARVEATLLFRRAFKALMDQKGWDAPDIVMQAEIVEVP